MNYRICRCCGEPMPETGNALSRNPNICASCSSMADGMEEPVVSENPCLAPGLELAPSRMEALDEQKAAELAAHRVPQ